MSIISLTKQATEQREDVLKLANSILENYQLDETFDKHSQYENFRLNDSKYLDALSLLQGHNDFLEIMKKFSLHFEDALKTEDPDDDKIFIILASNGNQTNKIKTIDKKTTSFYLGFNTNTPEAFLKPGGCFLKYDIKCGLLMNYYIKNGILLDAPYSYNNYITINNKYSHLVRHVLTQNGKIQDFYKQLSTIIYTKDLTDIPNHYMKNVSEHIRPDSLSNSQKAQYIRNVYKYASRSETDDTTISELLTEMEKYCEAITEWPMLKKQIITLNDLADVTFMNTDTVLALLMPSVHTQDLPEITF